MKQLTEEQLKEAESIIAQDPQLWCDVIWGSIISVANGLEKIDKLCGMLQYMNTFGETLFLTTAKKSNNFDSTVYELALNKLNKSQMLNSQK